MKSALLSAFVLFIAVNSAIAQFSLGAHVTPAFPLGDFGNTAGTGFGFDVEGRYQSDGAFIASAAIGYHSFAFEVGGVRSSNLSYNITPITFSLFYSLSESELQPYAGLGVGFNRVAYDVSLVNVSSTHFGISPTFGIQYGINEQLLFDINVKYSHTFSNNSGSVVDINDISYVPFNLGVFYTFEL